MSTPSKKKLNKKNSKSYKKKQEMRKLRRRQEKIKEHKYQMERKGLLSELDEMYRRVVRMTMMSMLYRGIGQKYIKKAEEAILDDPTNAEAVIERDRWKALVSELPSKEEQMEIIETLRKFKERAGDITDELEFMGEVSDIFIPLSDKFTYTETALKHIVSAVNEKRNYTVDGFNELKEVIAEKDTVVYEAADEPEKSDLSKVLDEFQAEITETFDEVMPEKTSLVETEQVIEVETEKEG